jgi:hypothetical protein
VKRLIYAGAVVALLAAFWLQMVLALPKLSATTDEVAHVPAGYTYWATRDFRLNPEHPPLVKLIAALPLLAIEPRLDLDWPEWQTAQEYTFGYGFLYTNDADTLLYWARLPMTLLATLGAWIVFLWARDMFGRASGLLALGLFAFSPNLLAHGMLVTTDIPLAVFMTLALYLVWKEQRSINVGLATGAAMAAKFSGAILPLILIAFSAWRVFTATGQTRKNEAVAEARRLAVAGLAALAVVQGSYLFQQPAWTYLTNMQSVNANHNPNHHYYLLGTLDLAGWWYYFPVAFAFKTTIPVLLTVVLATIHFASKRFIDRRGEMLLLVTAAAYTAALAAGADNLGVRYLLPVFPLLFIWCSRIAVELKAKRAGIALIVVLLAWQAQAALRAFPNYIPYFNEIAGGAPGGVYYLDDSNVDWGQGMKQAAEYVRKHELATVELLPFSPYDSPRYYGINRPQRNDVDTYRMMLSDHKPPGVYIVSAHHLIRLMYLRPEWNPENAIDRVGESLWVFRF